MRDCPQGAGGGELTAALGEFQGFSGPSLSVCTRFLPVIWGEGGEE